MLRRVARFGVVGAASTALNYLVFMSLVELGLHYLPAASIGWAGNIAASYVLNKRYTFASDSGFAWREFALFVTGCVLQLGVGLAGYAILIDGFGFALTPAFAVNLVFTSAFGFAFMQFGVFAPAPALATDTRP